MTGKGWRVGVLVALVALVTYVGARAQDGKATDEGKAEDFKGKTLAVKEKGKAAITLAFPADKPVTVTVKSTGKPDVNLFVYAGKKVIAKDDSPGPDCEVTFTPKQAGKLTLEVVNLGPGDTKSTIKVAFSKKKAKE
jgi:hypothetical protein